VVKECVQHADDGLTHSHRVVSDEEPTRERDMASTTTDEFVSTSDEDDFLAAFIAIVRENEMSALRDREHQPA
jgi:hypothetical protein